MLFSEGKRPDMASAPEQPPDETLDDSFEQLEGVVERLTYHSDTTGYTVAWIQVPGSHDLLKVSGSFASIEAGQTLRLTGFWRVHPKFGRQFEVRQYAELSPATLTGIEKYLGSGLIRGIGPVTARRIVQQFGLDTFDIIEHQSERLLEVLGISQMRYQHIRDAWEAQKVIHEVMVFLHGHGVSTTYAAKIFKHYGQEAIEVVTHNPYQLAADIYGIGFLTADKIARNLGIAPDSEFRYRAGLHYLLSEAAEEGHCFLPESELVERAVKQLGLEAYPVDCARIQDLIQHLEAEGGLILQRSDTEKQDQRDCYLPAFFHTERQLARQIVHLASQPVEVELPRVQRWIERYTQHHGISLSAQQQAAVEQAATSRILILTGGPGCGKTFTTRTVVALMKAMGKTLALAAPTGRAAQRLSELTAQEAKTLHRLLEFDPGTQRFQRDHENPLHAQFIVVDEASMLDLFLAHALVRAIPPEAQLLLVGDSDQLPSVGPGNVLRDLIASEQIPVIRLMEVFRQAQTSQIVLTAHQIQRGQMPKLQSLSSTSPSDCLWLDAPEPERGVETVRALVSMLLPQRGFDPHKEIQVLTPTTRGAVGTHQLNDVLQQVLNPSRPRTVQVSRGGVTLRAGDRVVQQVNDYEREVFNGDLGTVWSVDQEEQHVVVQFADRMVSYDYADLHELALAWALTIHKSQGSEYPAIIILLYPQHYLLLSRNLLYTALTRAKRLAILVGPVRAIGMAMKRSHDHQRYTALVQQLSRANNFPDA